MADISIRREHGLSLQQAKEAAQQIAERMPGEFQIATEWRGDVLSFHRSGVAGTLALHERAVTINVTRNFLFKVFASTLEEKIVHTLDESVQRSGRMCRRAAASMKMLQ